MINEPPRRERVGAWLLLLGTTVAGVGLVWDIQWHSDVGPDTFFTLPHLVMYLGSAISGTTALAVVLLTTRAADRAGAITVLRVFRAPLPFLLCGTAAAVGLLYGLADLWWHTVYGFDVTPTSPPHVAMSLMSLFDTVGLTLAFMMMRRSASGRFGLAAAVAASLASLVFLAYSTPPLPGIHSVVLAITAVAVILVAATAGALRSPKAVAMIAATYTVVQVVLWVFPMPATKLYAESLGLGLRDYVVGVPVMPITFPMATPLAALAFAVGMHFAVRRNWAPKTVVPMLGAVAGTLVALGYFIVPVFEPDPLTLVAGPLVGALAARIGWQLGSLGRAAATQESKELSHV
ncbi:hypothetical protein GCM10029976_008300 [Kribbella albertanoniae]|uniref:Uncharacterized protein n=1 Tax=Kribbella albertanoniae TaxID=1266829 RepID=A0A4R4PLW6_9ACTN|nr:hypothetical protein [Kribbella albertanoniae]TDC23034.1 hypothetical protein E1261_29395 [Kribbella albertanoniae]